MKTLLCLSFFFTAALGQTFNGGNSTWYCGFIKNEDCSTHKVQQRCGTDGVTYRNRCALGQAHCTDPSLHQAREGPCSSNDTITRSPEEVQHGSEIVLDFSCVMLSHRDCQPMYYEKICGTDGQTYPTFCEYEKARCMHRDLHVAKLGDCNA